MEPGIGVIPLRAVEGYSAGPATVIPVVVNDIMVGGLIVAFYACDSGSSHIGDGVADVLNMVRLLTEEAVGGDVLTV